MGTGGFQKARLGSTDLHSFDSGFAEVPLHLHVDLHVPHEAEDTEKERSQRLLKSNETEMASRSKSSNNESSPDVKI